jgi:hypothetical protein
MTTQAERATCQHVYRVERRWYGPVLVCVRCEKERP